MSPKNSDWNSLNYGSPSLTLFDSLAAIRPDSGANANASGLFNYPKLSSQDFCCKSRIPVILGSALMSPVKVHHS